MHVSVCVRAN